MTTDARLELVATKLQPPNLPNRLVGRPALARRLDDAVEGRRRLVLVSAPAGSGKSTTVAGWLAHRSDAAAWLQVEGSDADPARFWTYVVAAVDRAVPGLGGRAQPVVAASGGAADVVVPTLVNALADRTDPLVVVIDDYHLIEQPEVHHGVERFVELAPTAVTVVLLTRVDPPFRLGRLRVRHELAEIRAADLRFDPSEAGELLHGTLDARLAARLCQRTEGWAAGLVLAGMSSATAPDAAQFVERFGGSDTIVVDYLSEELLATLDPDDRQRMLETAVLDRLSGPLVDAVCGTDDGAAWLATLAGRNQLVIGLDRTGTWFRHHHLLLDVLRLEAQRSIADRLPALHRAAAQWHRTHGDIDVAVDHHLAAGDLETAADLIAEHATTLLNGGQIFTVLHQLDRLGDLPERHSGGALVRGWIDLVTGRLAGAARWFEIAGDHDDGTNLGIITALGVMVRVAEGDVAAGSALAETTVTPTESTQAVALGALRVWEGAHDRARPLLDLAAELAVSEPSDFAASVGGAFRALSALETGDLPTAQLRAQAAVDHAVASGVAETPQLAIAHAVVARTTSEAEAAVAAARRAVDLAGRSADRTLSTWVLATAGDVLIVNGDPTGADLLRRARAFVDQAPDPGIGGTTLARVEARHGVAGPPIDDGTLVEPLTQREIAVLRQLPTVRSQREIAGELFVSLNTVKTHCRNIYRKLGVGGRKAAVRRARELDLL